MCRFAHAVLAISLLSSMIASEANCVSAEEVGNVANQEQWLRGTAENLEMRIQGEIIDADGQPANEPIVTAVLRDNNSTRPIEVRLVGHRFEIWLPVHQVDWHSILLSATSNDNQRRSSVRAMRPALREWAINGFIVELQQSTRTVKANVVFQGVPVANANVTIRTSDGAVLQQVSDEEGAIKINLLPNEKIHSFTVWTDKPLFGGFQFSREPVRDPESESHTIELTSCRDQIIRVVDGNGKPCPGVIMHLQVATPQPHINYLGTIKASRMVTDQEGEAVFRWFPDWEEVFCYVDLDSDDWVIDGKSKWIDGDFVVQVKPRKARHRAVGKLNRKEGSKAGFNVFWRSFEGEQEGRSDHLTAVTDKQGNFSAEVLPGATYCVFINDTKHVSDMIDLIPIPTDDSPKPTATISLQKPEPLQIIVTAGPKKRPVPNQAFYVRQTHHYQWLENGESKSGSSARDQYVYTDDQGKATAMVQSGKDAEVSIYNPDWRTEQKKMIIEGDPGTITLHREIDEPRTILGVIIQDKQNPIPVIDITVTAGSVDGETRGSEQLELRDNGVFSFMTQATAVGMLATSKDRSVAGVVVADNPRRLLRLQLKPTKPLRGRLVDPDGKPIANRTVNATVRVMHEPKDKKLNKFYGFDADRHEAKTDTDGQYTFEGMPCDVEIALSAEAKTRRQSHWLGTVKLKSDEERPFKTDTIKD
ncbi:MAG: carboxypeptidase-like regulatory domain-containing protein [Pirellulaceae bacterium]